KDDTLQLFLTLLFQSLTTTLFPYTTLFRSHAVLDVFETEPLPEDHPLWAEEKVTITPHLSGISPNYLPRALDILERNLDVFVKGEDDYVNQIDTSLGY